MRKSVHPLLWSTLCIFLMSFTLQSSQEETKVPLIKFQELSPEINKDDNKTHVVNFWATYCGPCIKEMPDFQKTYEELGDRVDFLLVSLDFPTINDKVEKFVKKKKITIPGYHLDETDGNVWIPQVSKEWRGHIPATLIYNKSTGYREFRVGGLSKSELNKLIDEASAN